MGIEEEKAKYEDIYGNHRRYENTGELYGTIGHGVPMAPLLMDTFLPDTLLAIGCGYGKFPMHMMQEYGLRRVVGVDISSHIIGKLAVWWRSR